MTDPKNSGSPWLATSFAWDATALHASPAQQGPTSQKAAANRPRCQVEGCGSDLSELRYFFRKQRICERHARADVVTDRAGRQMRFCQQCTRLEPLINFAVGRRSCKSSLAKRQARAHRGKGHSSDSSPERGSGRRRAASKSSASSDELETSGSMGHSSRRSGGAAHSSKRSRGESPSMGPAPTRSPPLGGPAATKPAASHGLQSMVSNGSSPRGRAAPTAAQAPLAAQQAAAAEALLAQQQALRAQQQHVWQQQAQLAAQQAVQQQAAQQKQAARLAAQSHGPPWNAHSALADSELEELLAMDPDALADALLVSQGPPRGLGEPNGSSQMVGAEPEPRPVISLPTETQWASQARPLPQLAMLPPQLRVHPAAGPPTAAYGAAAAGSGARDGATSAAAFRPDSSSGFGSGASSATAWSAHPAAAHAAALQQAASGPAAAVLHASPMHVITRFSLKIFGVSPDHLPSPLRTELLAALQLSPTVLEGAIRCGCTHLVVDLLLSRQEEQQLCAAPRLMAAVQHIRRPENWPDHPSPPPIVAHVGQQVALGTAAAAAGSVMPLPCIHLGGAAQLLPRLELQGPAATTVGAARGSFRLRATPAPGVREQHRGSAMAASLFCRSHGRLVGLAVSRQRPQGARSSSDSSYAGSEAAADAEAAALEAAPAALADPELTAASLAAPGDAEAAAASVPQPVLLEAWAPEAANEEGWGLYEFEATSGSLLGEAQPVLVLPDEHAAAAAELQQLQEEEAQGRVPPGSTAAVLRLVAAVLRYLRQQQAAEAAGHSSSAAAALHAAYPPSAAGRLATVARCLSVLAVRARWPAVAALMLPAITADGSLAAAAAAELSALAAPAPTILHLAVASGSAATVAGLRSWSDSQGVSWEAVPAAGAGGSQLSAPPLGDLLLLAAAMGGSLTEEMVAHLAELLGPAGLDSAADDASLGGWSPRRVAQATGATALLAVLRPEAELRGESEEASDEGTDDLGSYTDLSSSQSSELLLPCPEKLAALEDDSWAPGCSGDAAAKPLLTGGGKGKRGVEAARRRRGAAPASHDAQVLASLLQEMQVPPEAQPQRWQLPRPASFVADLARKSLAGATACAVAATVALAVRLAAA